MKPMSEKDKLFHKPLCSAVTVYRERGVYLERLEQFEKAIHAYDQALEFNDADVRSYLGRSTARVKATQYSGAIEDAARAAELAPDSAMPLQVSAAALYESCALERALVAAHRGLCVRPNAPALADTARHAERCVRTCVGAHAAAVLRPGRVRGVEAVELPTDGFIHRPRRLPDAVAGGNVTPGQRSAAVDSDEGARTEKIYRLMAATYLGRMAGDKYFLSALRRDARLRSANTAGSLCLQALSDGAHQHIVRRQDVLREQRPMYAVRAARARLTGGARLVASRRAGAARAQALAAAEAQRLVAAVTALVVRRRTGAALRQAEFALEQLALRTSAMLPDKELYRGQLFDLMARAHFEQMRLNKNISETDNDRRVAVLLGMALSREPSQDSVLLQRLFTYKQAAEKRLATLERAATSAAISATEAGTERCYRLYELARLLLDLKPGPKPRLYASRCQIEARQCSHDVWNLNACFLLAKCHLMQNNRGEARAVLQEGAELAERHRWDVAEKFFRKCAEVVIEVESGGGINAALEKRERELVRLMPDAEMRSAAAHLFRRMSVIPTSRRFSIMPGSRADESGGGAGNLARRASIMPRDEPLAPPKRGPARRVLGYQDFDV